MSIPRDVDPILHAEREGREAARCETAYQYERFTPVECPPRFSQCVGDGYVIATDALTTEYGRFVDDPEGRKAMREWIKARAMGEVRA